MFPLMSLLGFNVALICPIINTKYCNVKIVIKEFFKAEAQTLKRFRYTIKHDIEHLTVCSANEAYNRCKALAG